MNMRFRAALALVFCGSLAHADLEILVGPGNFVGDTNILFEEPGTLNAGPLVQGLTNQTPGFLVDFYGAGENLLAIGSGQARLEAQDGLFTDLTLGLNTPGGTFLTFVGNLNAEANGSVTITVNQLVGASLVQTFSLDGAGQNFFRIRAFNGQQITSISFDSTVGIEDLRQVRLGGAANAVPAPAAALAFGLAALGRRRRTR